MPLSDADKTFIVATASLDPQRDKPAIYDAWRKTHGPAAADMSNQQVAARIRRMPSDEVKDEQEQLSALGSAARRVAVKDMNQEVFREREVLARISRRLLQEVEGALDDAEMSAATKQKWADLANKIVANRKPASGVDPAVAKALAERRQQLEAEKARIQRVAGVEEAAAAAPPAQSVAFVVEQNGRA